MFFSYSLLHFHILVSPQTRSIYSIVSICSSHVILFLGSVIVSAAVRIELILTFLVQMEHLKACAEIATQRTINWQKFCMKDDCRLFQISIATGNKLLRPVMLILLSFFPLLSSVSLLCLAVLYFLLQVSFLVDEGVSPVLLQLLSCALCGSKVLASSSSSSFSGGGSGSAGQTGASQSSQSKSSSKKSKKEDKEKDKEGESTISQIFSYFILILFFY